MLMGNHCKLYDENIVRNIMISTGVSIMEFVKEHDIASAEDVCEFIEVNADKIIAETIKNLNGDENVNENSEDDEDDDDDEEEDDDDDLPLIDEDEGDLFK